MYISFRYIVSDWLIAVDMENADDLQRPWFSPAIQWGLGTHKSGADADVEGVTDSQTIQLCKLI